MRDNGGVVTLNKRSLNEKFVNTLRPHEWLWYNPPGKMKPEPDNRFKQGELMTNSTVIGNSTLLH